MMLLDFYMSNKVKTFFCTMLSLLCTCFWETATYSSCESPITFIVIAHLKIYLKNIKCYSIKNICRQIFHAQSDGNGVTEQLGQQFWCHWKSMESWVGTTNMAFFSGLQCTYCFFFKSRSSTIRDRGTIQTLWSTIKLIIFLPDTSI